MRVKKFIVTHEAAGSVFSNAILIPDNYDKRLSAYVALFEEAKRSFPEITQDDVECSVVIKSGWCQGCPIMHISVPAGSAPDGWVQISDRLNDVAY